jgi:ubiquinone/menaquinone biosynthesis C-methylase UbiE
MNSIITTEETIVVEENDDPLGMSDLGLLLFGHSAFQYLLAGCELGVFQLLTKTPNLSKDELRESLGLATQPARVLLFGLASLKLIIKTGETYRNCLAVEAMFADGQWEVFYDTVRLEGHIIYLGQGDFTESLRQNRNVGLRHIPGHGPDLYHRLAENPALQEIFYKYMSSWSRHSNPLLLANVDFHNTRKVVDVGGGDATNAIAIAQAYPHLKITMLDIAQCCEIARDKIAANQLSDQITVCEGDMFTTEFPTGHDCFMFIHQLVIWPLDTNTLLLKRAYDALEPGGRVIIFSSMSSDTEDGPVMSALDTVYFVSLPADGGMIYAWKDYEGCLRGAGFEQIERFECHSWTPHGAIVATK